MKQRRPSERAEVQSIQDKMSTRPRLRVVMYRRTSFVDGSTESFPAWWGKYGKDWLKEGEDRADNKGWGPWEPVYEGTDEHGRFMLWPDGERMSYGSDEHGKFVLWSDGDKYYV